MGLRPAPADERRERQKSRGQGVVVARLPPKEEARVRFPLAAPVHKKTALPRRDGL